MSPASLKRAAAWTLLRSGALRLRRAHRERGRAILLVYHRVNDEADPFLPALPRAVFGAQLDHLAASYKVEPLEDVAAWLASGGEGPARAAITIDDGHPDTFAVVLPELERRGLPATLFLATGPPETGQPAWIDKARWIVKHARAAVLDAPGFGLARFPLPDSTARLALLARLLRHLKTLGDAAVEHAMAELEEALDPRGEPLAVLGWDEVRRIAAGPVRLGGHTHRHYMLSRLDDRRQQEEIETSVRLIRERTGATVSSFAYPNGEPADYDARAIGVLRRLGLRCAVTCRHGFARPGHDPFQLPRLYTSEPSLAVFAARLAGLGREEPAAAEVS